MSKRKIRKRGLGERLKECLDEYQNILIVTVNNVGSNQMQKVRIALRGKAVILMGKNTICRKIMREHAEAGHPEINAILPFVKGNIGLVFTNDNLNEVRQTILSNKVPAAAKAGADAPVDVIVPPGPTGLDPAQTSFFQTLNIGTKIVRGAIEIINEVKFLTKGDKVTASHVALLAKLNIKPFFYGITVDAVYENGSVYEASILDLSKDDLMAKFFNGVRRIAALSLGASYPTTAALPFYLGNAFRKMLAISMVTDYEFKEATEFKNRAASGPAVASAPSAGGAAAPAAAAAAKEEEPEEDEEDFDMGGMFD